VRAREAATAGINDEIASLKTAILDGRTTGDPLTDWSLACLGGAYAEGRRRAGGLNNYLHENRGQLVLLTMTHVINGEYVEGLGERSPPSISVQTYVIQDPTTLRVIKHPFFSMKEPGELDRTKIKMPERKPDEGCRSYGQRCLMAEYDVNFPHMMSRRHYEAQRWDSQRQPLVLCLELPENALVYAEERHDHKVTFKQQIPQQFLVEFGKINFPTLNPDFVASLEIDTDGAYTSHARFPLSPDPVEMDIGGIFFTDFRIAAGTNRVLPILRDIARNPQVMAARNVEEVYKALEVEKKKADSHH
jgi:hypothetical protein